jgi:hypothetical protein
VVRDQARWAFSKDGQRSCELFKGLIEILGLG